MTTHGPSFSRGLSLPWRGVRMMLTERRLWPYVAGPIAICTLFILLAGWTTLELGNGLTASVLSRPEAAGWWGNLLRSAWWVSNALVHLALFALLSLAGWFAASIFASPFYDQLSAEVEAMMLGEDWQNPGAEQSSVASDVATGILHSLYGALLYVSLFCPLLLLNLVPVLGQVAYTVVGGLLSAFFIAREVMDYSLSRRQLSFRQKLQLQRDNLRCVGGLGMSSFVLLWVPLANLVSMPAAVIGGTLLYCELEQAGRLARYDTPVT